MSRGSSNRRQISKENKAVFSRLLCGASCFSAKLCGIHDKRGACSVQLGRRSKSSRKIMAAPCITVHRPGSKGCYFPNFSLIFWRKKRKWIEYVLTVPLFLLMKGFFVQRNKWHGCEESSQVKNQKKTLQLHPWAVWCHVLDYCGGWWVVFTRWLLHKASPWRVWGTRAWKVKRCYT